MRKNQIREQIGRSNQNRGKSAFRLLQTGVVLFGMLLLLNGCGIFMTHDLLFNEDSSAGESAASEESEIEKPESKAEASSSSTPAPQKTPTPDRFQDSVDLEFYAEMGEDIICLLYTSHTAIGCRIAREMEVLYAYQQIESLPVGFSVPEGREKPWGTGHAVLSCACLLYTSRKRPKRKVHPRRRGLYLAGHSVL